MLCLAKLKNSSFGKDKNFGFVEESHIEATLVKAERQHRMWKWDFVDSCRNGFQGCDTLASELQEKIQHCKPKIKEDCLDFLDCLFQCDFSSDELLEFMMYISTSLHKLPHLKADMILDVKVKIESLKDKLDFFKEAFEFTAKRSCSNEDLNNFKIHIQAWVLNVACLSLLLWVHDEKQDYMASKVTVFLSDLQQKINTSSSQVTIMYLAVLKASKSSADDTFKVGILVSKFVELLLDDLQVDPAKDEIQTLYNGLILLITFLMDQPRAEYAKGEKLVLVQADAVVNEAASLIRLLSTGEFKEEIGTERNFLLHNFLEKVDAIKAEVRKLYAHLFLHPSSFLNFPKISIAGFIDSLIENLEEFSICFKKHQIVIVQEELLSLRNFLISQNLREFKMRELQNEHKKLKDLWMRIISVAYQAKRAISSFIYKNSFLWLHMLCLFHVTEESKLIKDEVKRIQDQHMYDIDAFNAETISRPVIPSQAIIPIMDEIVVGLEDKAKEIFDKLVGGSTKLNVISIVGMPGLGKTTLAKKVYCDPSVKYHFYKMAWCTVSQAYNSRELLLNILSDVTVLEDDTRGMNEGERAKKPNIHGMNEEEIAKKLNIRDMNEEGIAQRLYKCLKEEKYLIVLDDIWDVTAWDALKLSFPDDNNGSRIIFTSRIHNLVLEAKPDSSPYPLRALSEEESWELLENKLFQKNSCPPSFVEIGKHIATNCKGIPMAVVLTASLLKEKIKNLEWWKQIAESLSSWLAREGWIDLIEESYKHLPEFLKPCFLYFVSFPEDKEIRVQKLIQLWISEGLIQKHKTKRSEIVAKEYLMDLVSRSLVIVTKRSSTGGMKACSIHDLLWDFCLGKCEQENFFKVVKHNDAFQYSSVAICENDRLSVQGKGMDMFLNNPTSFHFIHTLLIYSHFDKQLPLNNFTYRQIWDTKEDCRFYGKFPKQLSLNSFTSLQVLDTEDCGFNGDFPKEVIALVLLRYLGISCGNVDQEKNPIPPSIKRLENLETLRIWTPFRCYLPTTVSGMKKLRHVKVKNCIPTKWYDNMPPLENVETFSSLWFSCRVEADRYLRKLPMIRRLSCQFESLGYHEKEYNEILKFNFLRYLESLTMHYTGLAFNNCAFYLPSTLKKLTLVNFRLPWNDVSAIAMLPNLEVLKLLENAFMGNMWNMGNEEFLKLKFLKLEDVYIKRWNASDGSFPCLENLVVEKCHFLEEIPCRFGSTLTLKRIEVKNCSCIIESSVKQIQEEQLNLGNEDLKVLAEMNVRGWDPLEEVMGRFFK